MSWFSRRGGGKKEEQALPPADHNQMPVDDRAVDALAHMMRVYGEYGFDTATLDHAELMRRCEAWARHITSGTVAPIGEDGTGPETVVASPDGAAADTPEHAGPQSGSAVVAEAIPMERRAFGDLQVFFAGQRKEEYRAVVKSTEGLRGLVGEMTRGLRAAINDDDVKDDVITRELGAMTEMVLRGTLTDIQSQFPKLVNVVTDVLASRKSRYEAQLASMSDMVHDLRAELMAARSEARLDPLTQLHNRGAFDDVLGKQIDYAFLSGQPLALVLLDLDHFKQINDTHGHPGGDVVLQKVADSMVRMVPRATDFIARYGGEEFAVILMEFDPSRLEALVNRILYGIRGLEIEHEGKEIPITASAGVAVYRRQDEASDLVERADRALYAAKRAGRDRAVLDDTPAAAR